MPNTVDGPDFECKPIILCFVAVYLPGFRSGGPVRTIANFVDHLSDDFDIRIVAADRDRTMTVPYPEVTVNGWNKVGSARVYYLSSDMQTVRSVARLMRETPHDVLYLNSYFDFKFTALPLLARKLRMAPQRPCVIAPRGEFSPNAIRMKSWKKRPYRFLANLFQIYSGLQWQASSEFEVADIQRTIGPGALGISVAPDLASSEARKAVFSAQASSLPLSSPLRLLFLSRITPMKNLDFALRALQSVQADVSFSIYGPIVDKAFWKSCQPLLASLPPNVKVTIHGPVEHEHTQSLLRSSHLLFLPTRGENYGHVIAESISAGTPVLISDQTPWRNLQQHGAGWDFSLSDPDQFTRQIDAIASMPPAAYATLRQSTLAFASTLHASSSAIEKNRTLFLHALPLLASPRP